MSKMKDIAIELQQAEETIQRDIHITEYLENKLKRANTLNENLRAQMEQMNQEMYEQNLAFKAMKVILDEYIEPKSKTEQIITKWKYEGVPGIGKSCSVDHIDLGGFPGY